MDNKTKWTTIGAASLLSMGMLAAGAVTTANALGLSDDWGQPAGLDRISTVENATDVPRFIGSPASVISVSDIASTNSPVAPDSSTDDDSLESVPSAAEPEPVSPPSAESPASPVSVPSVASVESD